MKIQRFKSFIAYLPLVIIILLTILGILDGYFGVIDKVKSNTKNYRRDRIQSQPVPTPVVNQCLPCSQ